MDTRLMAVVMKRHSWCPESSTRTGSSALPNPHRGVPAARAELTGSRPYTVLLTAPHCGLARRLETRAQIGWATWF